MAELSELTGISMATLADSEKGKREPYERALRDIKVALKSKGASFLELSEVGVGCGFMKSSRQLRFVDLFSGLGGFHAALERLGHTCVFASEIDDELREIYALNFGFNPSSNIRDTWKDIPEHEILCAGSPCQPFSKAGPQRGFDCLESGDLFDYILKTIDRHLPSFLIFENVPNILHHAEGKIIQFRASGIRVKSPSAAPSLVALTTSQVPVISWERRYMTMVECARRQCLDSLNELLSSKTRAFKALGKAVNVDVIAAVAEKLIGQGLDSRDLNEAMRLSA